MKRFTTKKLVMAALFAALACVATMSIRIPTPGTGGTYIPATRGDTLRHFSGPCKRLSGCRYWLLYG